MPLNKGFLGFEGQEYRYTFNGKEAERGIAEGDYDFGARIYDGRLGRWMSVDPCQYKYPNLSPYNTFENSPISLIDPDGKDARYSLNKRTITISTVIHIYGPGASKEMAQKMEAMLHKVYKNSSFIGNDGNKYNIKFDIKVQYHSENSYKELKGIQKGDNIVYVSDESEENMRSHVINGNYGVFSKTLGKGVSHEVGHFLGLADRYYDQVRVDPNDWNSSGLKKNPDCKKDCDYEIYSTPYPGVSKNDLMAGGDKLMPDQIKAIGNEILKNVSISEREHGVLALRSMSLAKPPQTGFVPPTLPADINPKQLENIKR